MFIKGCPYIIPLHRVHLDVHKGVFIHHSMSIRYIEMYIKGVHTSFHYIVYS